MFLYFFAAVIVFSKMGTLFCLEESCNLNLYEKKVFSQNGEDGIIEKIFEIIGTKDKYYVEFGVENGRECNTRYLREHYGWTGLLMDGGFENESINLKKEFITAENILGLFEKYNVPKEFDLLSIDIDFNDFYVWKAIGFNYRPRVVVMEFNATLAPDEDKIVPYSPNQRWDGTTFFGASLLAYYLLGKTLGYSLVCTDKLGVNSFFIRNDVLDELKVKFTHINDVSKLYNLPFYLRAYRQDTENRSFVSAKDILGLNDKTEL